MKDIKVPDWWDSIRAIIALVLISTYCATMFISEIPAEKITGLEKLTMLALTFYYVLKKRPKEEKQEGGENK